MILFYNFCNSQTLPNFSRKITLTFCPQELRSDALRRHKISSFQTRVRKSQRERPRDIETFTPSFLSVYETLIPAEEDKANQEHLLSLLAKSLNKEWPEAQLHLYGSWANTFGFSNSDIDMCIAIDDSPASNHNMLLKVADIMKLNNFQNVQVGPEIHFTCIYSFENSPIVWL